MKKVLDTMKLKTMELKLRTMLKVTKLIVKDNKEMTEKIDRIKEIYFKEVKKFDDVRQFQLEKGNLQAVMIGSAIEKNVLNLPVSTKKTGEENLDILYKGIKDVQTYNNKFGQLVK